MEQAGFVSLNRSETIETFGQRLMKARKARGLSIRQLSEKTGIGHVTHANM